MDTAADVVSFEVGDVMNELVEQDSGACPVNTIYICIWFGDCCQLMGHFLGVSFGPVMDPVRIEMNCVSDVAYVCVPGRRFVGTS